MNQSAPLFILILTIVDGHRWYSATTFESDSNLYQTPKPTSQLAARPLYLINSTANKTKWSYDTKKQLKADQKRYDEALLPIQTVEQNSTKFTSTRAPVSFRFNNTIATVNVVRSSKPRKRIVRKCPPIRSSRPRQKKQLNGKSRTRFLEVFEVVEFDHVACVSSSGLTGICLPEQHCLESGSIPMGSCADGYGTCCVTQFSCDDETAAINGWFTNPGFPSPSTDRLSCTVKVNKVSSAITQIRLDFTNFELLPPIVGTCEQDQFVVSGQDVNNIIPILCGVNTGQHLYIEVGNSDGPITLSIQTVSSDTRLFSIQVTQLTASDERAAPSGCLQYYRESQGYLESWNYRDKSDIAIARIPSYLNNLNYAMCIERVPGTCSITYTNTGTFQIVNYDSEGLPVIPPGQAGVEIFNCPTDWLLMSAVRVCGDKLNDGSVLQDFSLDAPVTVIPPGPAGVEIFNCPTDWLLMSAVRVCGDKLNDGSVLQDFSLDAPVTDVSAGPIVVWFRSDGGYVGRGFRLQYQQNNC